MTIYVGADHQGLEDLAIARVLPNMTVITPADANQAGAATLAAAEWPGPVYLRLAREKAPVFYRREAPFRVGGAEILREGTDVTIVACGPMVYRALEAALLLRGVSAEVINMATIKPLDVEMLVKSVKKTGRVVTVEDHQIIGGLGGAVAEELVEEYPVPMRRVGMPDSFGESGKAGELWEKYGMTKDDIVKAVIDVVG